MSMYEFLNLSTRMIFKLSHCCPVKSRVESLKDHMGFRQKIKRSTLADANETRDGLHDA